MMGIVWVLVLYVLLFTYFGLVDKFGEMREKVCFVIRGIGSDWGGFNFFV